MVNKADLGTIVKFIITHKKKINPTHTEWGYECLSLTDVFNLLNLLGFKLTRDKYNGKD